MSNSIREIFLLFVCLAVAFAVGAVAGRQTYHAPNEAVAIEIPDMEYKGDLLMTVAVGMCGTAVMTDVSFAASDPDMTREIAFHHWSNDYDHIYISKVFTDTPIPDWVRETEKVHIGGRFNT